MYAHFFDSPLHFVQDGQAFNKVAQDYSEDKAKGAPKFTNYLLIQTLP